MGLLFYNTYAIVVLDYIKNKKMTESHTTSTNTTEQQPDEWSSEASEARSKANRPTAENPLLFDIEDAIKLVSFEQVPGEKLSGSVVGYFYNGSGEKINIVAPSSQSRELLEARGGTTSDGLIRVPESFLNGRRSERAVEIAEQEPVVSSETIDDLGETALDAVNSYDDLFSPDREFGSVEDAAVRTESEEARLTRERRASDLVDAAIKRAGRPEMN